MEPDFFKTVEAQHAFWNRESETIDAKRVLEVVTQEMWEHEAEKAAAKLFGISVPAAVYLVQRAERYGFVDLSLGKVRPTSFSAGFRRRCALLLERGKKPECPEVVPLVREYYSQLGNGAGGSLHVVLDDNNVEDSFVDGAIGHALSMGDIDGMALAAVLRMMSKTQRYKLSVIGPGSSSG